ncbi:MAG: beta-ketoacyl-[acyl-carrier-protein] synthase family protein, partial [bacterium]
MQERKAVVTGAGIVCAAGCGLDEVSTSLEAGRSGLGPLTLFKSTRFGHVLVGQVTADIGRLTAGFRGSRSDRLAWIAANEALARAGLLPGSRSDRDPRRFGVVTGGTVGGMGQSEGVVRTLLLEHKFRCGPFRFHECACSTMACARAAGAKGPCITLSSACSASAMGIAAAAEMIVAGDADRVLAGGCDSLSRLTLNGFGSLLLIDPAGNRPFDATRAGIALGEGAAFVVLELEEAARARGARVIAELSGWGLSCDAYHATAPQPEGAGAAAAMRAALQRAGLQPSDISYINAHGTATRDNDLMEARALKLVFDGRPPPFSSTMRFFGHTLAASGAMKAVVCLDALERQRVHGNPGFDTVDPEIGLEPVRVCRPAAVDHVMSNSFGFGGNNASLVFSRPGAGRAKSDSGMSRGCGGVAVASGRKLERLAVVGAGIVGPAGTGAAAFLEACRGGHVATGVREMPPCLPAAKVPAYVVGPFGAETVLAPGRRRKLARLQQMALVAAREGLPPGLLASFKAERACVAVGTGMGMLNEASSFVENMIANNEHAPQPLCFTNSVHNALASQVAMELGLKGMNT